jgi:cholesterol oxidase
MPRISLPVERIKDRYSVVVIGSGYGGAISASRMARAGQSVCLLERGKELQPGEYPNTLEKANLEFQVDAPAGHIGSATGMFDFRVNEDINVVLGCGLGGTSLINANVGLRAEPRVFEDPAWPEDFRKDTALLEKCYALAEDALNLKPVPEDFPRLPKMEAHKKSAEAMGAKFYRTPLYVTFEEPKDGVNQFGVEQHSCNGCGDCVTGCNFHAKNTTLMNYLPDAVNFGAEIFTEVSVKYLEQKGDGWLVHFQAVGAGREKFGAPDLFVEADVVILGAGALGSTEILLRSAQHGLPISDMTGQRFTGNGDILGFGYNTDTEINGIGFGDHNPKSREVVGPCITSVIDLREQPELDKGMVIEEGSIPGAISSLMAVGLSCAATLGGKLPETLYEAVEMKKRELESLVGGPYVGAVHNSQTYLIMTHDDGEGRMYLENDRLRVSWPGVGREEIIARGNENLKIATKPLGGVYAPNPAWHSLQSKSLITVHPLGGCGMAEDASKGVVNHKGQVFAGPNGTGVYSSLYVNDGAALPRSVGVNPTLTISAIAERTCAIIAQDRGWTIDSTRGSSPKKAVAATVGIEFTETMKGFWAAGAADFATGAKQGKTAGNTFQFTLTIRADDAERMLAEPGHAADMSGTVLAPALSAKPLTVNGGTFQLFVTNPGEVETRNMLYHMTLLSEEGTKWHLEGFKVVHHGPVTKIWPDTSTLYITLRENDENGAVLGMGILHIEPADFARQMTTMKATNASSEEERLKTIAAFGKFFAGTLFDTYGGIFTGSTAFDPDAPPRQKRALRVGAPVVYTFPAKDGVPLRLTRYQGGTKGPVILSHGLGVSSLIFSLDTIDTNMLEYLYSHGYDVWLLDFRNSILLPDDANMQASGDDVALNDYPAAVDKVRAVTGVPDVQMVVHCWGSTTFFMAMLAGLKGVRSVVASQIATHPVSPLAMHLKTGLHFPTFLDAVGIKSLSAFASTKESFIEKVYDEGLRFYPIPSREQCRNSTCHRITFMYAPLYNHAQLNDLTHETLHEGWGVANMKAFEHLARLTNTGHLVDFEGRDVYLPHLDRLALPITFIHGADNACFLPESTHITYDLLCKANGASYYDRHVISGYGHIDCIFGKDAVRDIYPLILNALEPYATSIPKSVGATAGAVDGGATFTQVHHPDFSLWQSAVEETVVKSNGLGGKLRAAAHDMIDATHAVALKIADGNIHDVITPAHQALEESQNPNEGWGKYCSSIWWEIAKAEAAGDKQAEQAWRAQLGKFTTCDVRYADVAAQYVAWKARDAKIPYKRWHNVSDFIIDLPAKARIAIIGDWGTGRPEARALLQSVANKNPDVAIHLGDVYYSGTEFEVENYFAEIWNKTFDPKKVRSFTLAGNHDMYSGGAAYYKLIADLGQPASYFCLRNDDWQFVALDTGLHDDQALDAKPTYLEETELTWLKDKIATANGRRTVLMSHHQLFTANEDIGGQSVNGHLQGQVGPLLNDVALWLWGHEHNQVIYKNWQGVLARCIGHGGYPVGITEIKGPKFPDVPIEPAGILKKGSSFYSHGYAIMDIDGASARLSYYQDSDAENQAMFVEEVGVAVAAAGK